MNLGESTLRLAAMGAFWCTFKIIETVDQAWSIKEPVILLSLLSLNEN